MCDKIITVSSEIWKNKSLWEDGNMKIQYLGTAAAEGIPAIWCDCPVCRKVRMTMGKDQRSRSQAIIDDRLLVDFPQDAYWHMIQNHLAFCGIKNVIITHSHQDHLYPDDFGMRSRVYANNITGPVHVWGNEKVIDGVRHALEIDIPGRVEVHTVQEYVPLQIDGFTITPVLAHHDPQEKCLLYIIEKDGKRMMYGNDTGEWLPQTWDYIEQNRLHFDLVSMDCTMGNTVLYEGHMGIPNVLNTLERLEKDNLIDGNTKKIVTHFSHNNYIFYEDMKEMLAPYGIEPTYDGMTVEF